MPPTRRIALLSALAAAGPRGLTMIEGRFTAHDVADLGSLVARLPGPNGLYCLTAAGQRYLNVRKKGQAA